MSGKTTLDVELDAETRDRLEVLGSLRQRSPHQLLRDAISQYLDREEAREQEDQLVQDRWERYLRDGEAIDHATAVAWMKSLKSSQPIPRPTGKK